MSTAWFSLRKRLLISLIGGLTVMWLLILAWTYTDTHHEIDEIFDAQLAQAAQQALEQFIHGGVRPRSAPGDARPLGDDDRELFGEAHSGPPHIAHQYQQQIAFQIWDRHGRLLLRSPSAPDTPLIEDDGFSELSRHDGHWRFYSEWTANHAVRVVVGQSHQIRDELIGKITARLALPLLIGLPLSAFWIGLALTRGLAPLREVTRQISSRGPQQMEAVTPAQAPEEIRPMVESLNDLLSRLSRAMEGERRFTADAAHELRTPLAGLRAQAQVALRAEDDASRRHALEQVLAGTARAAHLIDQLLTLARLDPGRPQVAAGSADLARIANDVCAELAPSTLGREIALSFDNEGDAAHPVACNADWLRILIRNLVDNALRYSPSFGTVQVSVSDHAGGATLAVIDDGPGIPVEQRQSVFKRFHRLAGQDIEGSGLGLSIVARIAELAGATIELDEGSEGRGLAVRVRFPGTSAT